MRYVLFVLISSFVCCTSRSLAECSLTLADESLLTRVVVHSKMWLPSRPFGKSAGKGYRIRWARAGSMLIVSSAEPLAEEFSRWRLDIPVYEVGASLRNLLAVRYIAWTDNEADPLAAYLQQVAAERGVTIEGPCSAVLAPSPLSANRPVSSDLIARLSTELVPRLRAELRSSFSGDAVCKGYFIPPYSLESRAVGRITCSDREGKENFYFSIVLSSDWRVDAVSLGFDPPRHQAVEYAHKSVEGRARRLVEFSLR